MKKLFIWGAGDIGRRISHHFSKNWEIVFVDTNAGSKNPCFHEIPIISVEEYLKNFSDQFILVAHLRESESIKILQQNNIENYFVYYDLPGEFKEPVTRCNLKNYVCRYCGTRKDYILFGLNLYSIIIDEWIFDQFHFHPRILLQNSLSNQYVDMIQIKFPELNLVDHIDNLSEIKEICVCLQKSDELKQLHDFDNCLLTDIYDCSDRIDDYYNPLIKKFHNLYRGGQCVIVATGPSLRTEDLETLKMQNIVTFSLNGIVRIFEQTSWRPTFYVIDDYRAIEQYQNEIHLIPEHTAFIADTSKQFWEKTHEKNVIKFHKHCEYYADQLPKFSDDFSRKNYMGLTVTYTCMQLAVYMGFQTIYLLGVDFSYGNQQKNIHYAHCYQEESLQAIGYVKQVYLAYKAAKKYADSHGIKIYNATRGGNLELFERVDFDQIFNS